MRKVNGISEVHCIKDIEFGKLEILERIARSLESIAEYAEFLIRRDFNDRT